MCSGLPKDELYRSRKHILLSNCGFWICAHAPFTPLGVAHALWLKLRMGPGYYGGGGAKSAYMWGQNKSHVFFTEFLEWPFMEGAKCLR